MFLFNRKSNATSTPRESTGGEIKKENTASSPTSNVSQALENLMLSGSSGHRGIALSSSSGSRLYSPLASGIKQEATSPDSSTGLVTSSGSKRRKQKAVSVSPAVLFMQQQTESLKKDQSSSSETNMSVLIPNNMAVDIPHPPLASSVDPSAAVIVAPFHGNEESLLESTNSPFTKVSELIAYTWMKQSNVNLVAVHRSKPLVAYVINVSYHKSFVTGKLSSYNPGVPEQMIRLINYKNQSRALCKMVAVDVVVDIAFSYDEVEENDNKRDLIATIDRSGYINLFNYTEIEVADSTSNKFQMSLFRFMTIQPPQGWDLDYSFIRLSWCPYVPTADDEEPNVNPSTRLAVTLGQNLEIITLNDMHINTAASVEVPRSYFKPELGEYYCLPTVHDKEIVSLSISNDGTLVCTTGVDNVVKFFKENMEGNVLSMNKMREWTPKIPSDQTIAHTCFLDDYDYLLDHPEYPYWGFMFIGTTGGNMYIYDLQRKDWKCIQEVQVKLENDSTPDASFSFFVDTCSRVILATRGNTVFVFLIEYIEQQQQPSGNGSDDNDACQRIPRIKQVARFQLYNPVISFSVKVPNDNEIDIFWITLKSLERCTVNISQMNECKVTSPQTVATLPTSGSKSKKVNTVTPSPMKPLSTSSSTNILSPEIPPSVLAAQAKVDQLSNELNKLKRKSDAKEMSDKKSYSSISLNQMLQSSLQSPSSGAATSTTSASSVIPSKQVNLPGTPVLPSSSFSMPSPLLSSLQVSTLNDTAKVMLLEERMQKMQNEILANMGTMQSKITAAFTGIQSEIYHLKAHVSQPPPAPVIPQQTIEEKNKLMEKTINKVVSKAMEQLNVTVSRGLKDFFDQVDVGIGELQTTVKTVNHDIQTELQETNQRLAEVRQQMEIFQKQLEKNEAEQQIVLYRLSQASSLR